MRARSGAGANSSRCANDQGCSRPALARLQAQGRRASDVCRRAPFASLARRGTRLVALRCLAWHQRRACRFCYFHDRRTVALRDVGDRFPVQQGCFGLKGLAPARFGWLWFYAVLSRSLRAVVYLRGPSCWCHSAMPCRPVARCIKSAPQVRCHVVQVRGPSDRSTPRPPYANGHIFLS